MLSISGKAAGYCVARVEASGLELRPYSGTSVAETAAVSVSTW